jgi:cbb3-type cytochrome oxidase subunit 3
LLAQPVRWMKMTLVVLFFSIFFAAVTRYVYLCLHDNPQGTLGVSTHH